jgi:hypothetical protein
MTAAKPRLLITADLRVEVGGAEATVTASGSHVTVRADSPERLWSELNRAALPSSVGRVSGPRAVGRAAELLRDNGLDVQIEGPQGVLVRLGTGVHSGWGRSVFGSSAVQLVSLRSLRPIATAAVLQAVSRRPLESLSRSPSGDGREVCSRSSSVPRRRNAHLGRVPVAGELAGGDSLPRTCGTIGL